MSNFGYAGEILKVDLSTLRISKLKTADYADRFLGGRGIAAKIYWDETPPDIKAFDSQNSLIFMTGPVAGFTRFAGSRFQVCAKSAEMEPNYFTYANMGGSWGAWLKYSGYDGLVITGKADKPVYLYIDSDITEIRDASHLWGRTALETQNILQSELGKETRILDIGPAAENLVSFATILSAENASGSSGLGSVMGSKKLKAVAVKADNKKRPLAADPERLQLLARQVFETYSKNWEDGHQKTLTGRQTACYGCISGCSRRTYEAENGQKFKSYCQATLVYMEQALKNPEGGTEAFRLATRLCDQYGLDTCVMEPLIRWISLCFQAGILSEEETGLPLSKMGTSEFIETLVRKISFREGFGDILAQGIIKAAAYVGRDSQKLFDRAGVTTKASETKDYDPRMILTNSLIYATEPRRAIQLLHAMAIPLRRWVNWNNGLTDAFLSTEVFQKIACKYWGGATAVDFSTYEGKALAAKNIQDYGCVKDSLILCDTLWPIHQVHLPYDLGLCTLESQILSAITGRKIDEKELMQIGERIFNLQRAILIREGWGGRQGDTLLDYFHEEPLERVYWSPDCLAPGKNDEVISRKGKVVDRSQFEKMKSEYYALRGWDIESGLQTKIKLEALNLAEIARDLENRTLLR